MNLKKPMTKYLSALLYLLMLVNMLPVSTLAAEKSAGQATVTGAQKYNIKVAVVAYCGNNPVNGLVLLTATDTSRDLYFDDCEISIEAKAIGGGVLSVYADVKYKCPGCNAEHEKSTSISIRGFSCKEVYDKTQYATFDNDDKYELSVIKHVDYGPNYHNMSYEQIVGNNSKGHIGRCSRCCVVDLAECTDDGTANCVTEGKCTVCGYPAGGVNPNAHSPANTWSTENGKHYKVCTNGCGNKLEEAFCSGGTATCLARATCSTCDKQYGSLGKHDLTYSASGNTLTESCSRGDHTATAALSTTQSSYTYTGQAITPVKMNYPADWEGAIPQPQPEHYTANTAVGTASCTFPYETASTTVNTTLQFPIQEAALTVNASDNSKVYDGNSHGITVTATGVDGKSAVVHYGEAEGTYDLDTCPTIIDVGTKTIYYQAMLDNHTTATGSATVTINPKALEPSMVAQTPTSGTYTGEVHDPEVTLSYGSSKLKKGYDYTLTDWSGEGRMVTPGIYTATVTAAENRNFDGELTLTYNITNAELTERKVEQSGTLTYNKESHTPAVDASASAQGGQAVTFTYSITQNGTYGDMPSFTNAGSYTVYYKASAQYHNDAFGTFTVTIGPADATITIPENQSVIYDGQQISPMDIDFTYNGDNACSVKFYADNNGTRGEEIHSPSNVGTYWIGVSAEEGNYKAVEEFQTFTIAKRPVTITANDQEISYGGTLTENAVTTEDPVGGHSVSAVTLTPTGNTVGTHEIAPSAATITDGNNNDVTKNYEITYNNGTLTVSKSKPTIQFVKQLTGKTYDGSPLTNPTADDLDITGAYFSDVSFLWYRENGETDILQDSAPTDAGTYYVVASIADTANTDCAEAMSESVTISPLNIEKADITLGPTLTYNGTEQTQIVTEVKIGDLVVNKFTVTGNKQTHAGSGYTLTVSIEDGDDGNFTGSATKTWGIARKKVTVTGLTAQNREYNGETGVMLNNDGTLNGLVEGETVAINWANAKATMDDADAGENKKVTVRGLTLTSVSNSRSLTDTGNTMPGGNTPPLPGGGSTINPGYVIFMHSNYELTQPTDVTVDIAPKTVSISGITAVNRVYNGSREVALSGGSVNGAIGNDDIQVSLKNAKGTMADANAGNTKPVTITGATLKGDDAGNYALKEQPTGVTVNIAKAESDGKQESLTISNAVAHTYSFDLNKLLPALGDGLSYGNVTYALVSHTLPGTYCDQAPTIEGNTLSLPIKKVDSTETESIGTMTIRITTDNYTVTNGTIEVLRTNKRIATITGAKAANSLTYNGKPQSGYTGTPAVEGFTGSFLLEYTGTQTDGKAYGPTAAAPTNAGTYSVKISIPESDVQFQGDTTLNFTIGKAPLTIQAEDKTAKIGEKMPKLTYKVTGLFGTDKLAEEPALTCNADMDKAGRYTITPHGGEANANYEIVACSTGTLTVKSEYSIRVKDDKNGDVSISQTKASEGTQIIITATPKNRWYKLKTLVVTDADGERVTVTDAGHGKFAFTMPASDVTVKASFRAKVSAIADPTNPKTGDDFKIIFWNGMMITALLSVAALLMNKKKLYER